MHLNPEPLIFPLPALLITVAEPGGRANIIAIAWAGVVSSGPPMISIAVRPGRYSHPILCRTREFVANVPGADLARAVDLCGSISGRDNDKFQQAGLTPLPARQVGAPYIAECPVNLECRVRHILGLGAHDLFVAEVVHAHVQDGYLDSQGRIDYAKVNPVAYVHGAYWSLGQELAGRGFSVQDRE